MNLEKLNTVNDYRLVYFIWQKRANKVYCLSLDKDFKSNHFKRCGSLFSELLRRMNQLVVECFNVFGVILENLNFAEQTIEIDPEINLRKYSFQKIGFVIKS